MPRRAAILMLAATLALGLAARAVRHRLPGVLSDAIPDGLWGAAVMWIVVAVATQLRIASAAAIAGLLAVGIEFFKLYDPPLVHAFRWSLLGGLVLGHTFTPLKIVWYIVGIAGSAYMAHRLHAKSNQRQDTAMVASK